ncbi:MAG: twin-arginine translocase TatA/TatE family subunit [Nitrososphaerota archaeon]|nr:twin-arginine translocase TatA/TatE family subunit [Nitrososphaerota archaeon]
MALDDPVVWVLILAAVIFLFGSNKIPQFARAIGQARREFESGWKGISNEITSATAPPVRAAISPVVTPQAKELSPTDPLVVACRNEGIDTTGKTREQLSSELAWKLNKK